MPDVTIRVSAEHDYDVVIGRGLQSALLPMVAGSRRVAVIHPEALAAHSVEHCGRSFWTRASSSR